MTGGRLRGRALAAPKGVQIRPTADKVKEAVFDLIGQDMEGVKVLDLFAGTGGLGIEALSRGAQWALFVDLSPTSVRLIRRNLLLTGCEPLGEVIRKDLSRGLPRRCETLKGEIDLVFIDPPYGKGHIPPLLGELVSAGILKDRSVVVVESGKDERLPESFRSLELVKARVYGDTKISIYSQSTRNREARYETEGRDLPGNVRSHH
ncbi:MAG: 16S rRNA (guanine(966)-N(2))-methyltransferase RsmD [Thermodesulfobacteriota bacterium]